MKSASRKALAAYTPISDRIIIVRLKAKPKPLTIIQVYAPTSHMMRKPKKVSTNSYTMSLTKSIKEIFAL